MHDLREKRLSGQSQNTFIWQVKGVVGAQRFHRALIKMASDRQEWTRRAANQPTD